MNGPRIEYQDKIKTSSGIIYRYRHYFSGKMEVIETKTPMSGIKITPGAKTIFPTSGKRSIKIKYRNEIFPKILHSEEDYEVQEVLIPEASGDYFLCRISSAGEYNLIDYVGADEVTIIRG